MPQENWDDYFLKMCRLVASKSKDQSTQTGCVIVGPDNEIRTTGYNGPPRGVNDEVTDRHNRPEKYYWFEHAERNAIYNAARHGSALAGCKLYVNWFPCADCARAIIQCGIVEVIVDEAGRQLGGRRWDEHIQRSGQMFTEAGLPVRWARCNDET